MYFLQYENLLMIWRNRYKHAFHQRPIYIGLPTLLLDMRFNLSFPK